MKNKLIALTFVAVSIGMLTVAVAQDIMDPKDAQIATLQKRIQFLNMKTAMLEQHLHTCQSAQLDAVVQAQMDASEKLQKNADQIRRSATK